MNKKSYDVFVRNLSSFNLIIFGTTIGTSLLFRSNSFIRIVNQIRASNRITKVIRIGYLRISSTVSKVRVRLVSNVSVSRVRINVLSFRSQVIMSSIVSLGINIVSNNRTSIRNIRTITIPRIRIISSALLGQFRTLNNYSSSTLGTLDTQTLGTLDFVAV